MSVYASGREPNLTRIEAVRLMASQQAAWADDRLSMEDGLGGSYARYLKGYADAMREVIIMAEEGV